jgi:hypothetical protein
MTLAKALLIELNPDFKAEKPGGQKTTVQFNPETLKVTYANQIIQPTGGDQSSGNAGQQFVGKGTTKLALQLWFDVTAKEDKIVKDVRMLTGQVVFFMTPRDSSDPKKMIAPAVRFVWGTFQFDGMVDGVEETLEYFAPDGTPLRASMTLSITQQKILEIRQYKEDGKPPARPGQKPLAPAKSGDSLQGMAGKDGNRDWQSVAAANAIEDPLRMPAGQLVDLSASVGGSVGGSFGATVSLGVNASISSPASPASASLNGSLGGVSGSFSVS